VIADALVPIVLAPASSVVLVDFDGSLAPIVDDPEAAAPLPAARQALAALVGRVGRVGVVSGRPAEFLRAALALDGVVLVGQYGLERVVDRRVVVDPRVERYRATVATVAAEAERALAGIRVERKGDVAVAIHWRQNPGRADEARHWADGAASASGLELHPGRMVAELRPPIAVDKGSAVELLCAGMRVALFAGDDRGDLPAFDALDRLVAGGALDQAVRVGVRSSEEPSEVIARADLHVDGPEGLAHLLLDLATAIP